MTQAILDSIKINMNYEYIFAQYLLSLTIQYKI
jgi:hypothetical protein